MCACGIKTKFIKYLAKQFITLKQQHNNSITRHTNKQLSITNKISHLYCNNDTGPPYNVPHYINDFHSPLQLCCIGIQLDKCIYKLWTILICRQKLLKGKFSARLNASFKLYYTITLQLKGFVFQHMFNKVSYYSTQDASKYSQWNSPHASSWSRTIPKVHCHTG